MRFSSSATQKSQIPLLFFCLLSLLKDQFHFALDLVTADGAFAFTHLTVCHLDEGGRWDLYGSKIGVWNTQTDAGMEFARVEHSGIGATAPHPSAIFQI